MEEPKKLRELDGAKFLLIIGVVIIHSDFINNLNGQTFDGCAAWILRLISQSVCGVCVPIFFILSGFLMFVNVRKLTIAIYKQKLKNRVNTLLIPYLLWNIIGCLIFIVKSRWLGFSSFGVWHDGGFDVLRFIQGFWNLQDGYPYDFPLWFIRNLIIFVLLSPLAYVISRNNVLMLILLALCIIFGNILYGFMYFIIGGWLACHRAVFDRINTEYNGIIGIVIWISLSIVATIHLPERAEGIIYILRNLAALPSFLFMGKVFTSKITKVRNVLMSSTFFVFAFHGFYVTVFRKAVLHVIGDSDFIELMSSYIVTIVGIYCSALLGYLLARFLMPKFTNVLCGGRSA